jgi:uncharacterized protein (DUF342 family)
MFSYQTSLAEVERISRQEREAAHDELCSLKKQHRQEIENVKQDYLAQHSGSKLSEMTNKIASLEIVIERLKAKLANSAEPEAELASKKVDIYTNLFTQISYFIAWLRHLIRCYNF